MFLCAWSDVLPANVAPMDGALPSRGIGPEVCSDNGSHSSSSDAEVVCSSSHPVERPHGGRTTAVGEPLSGRARSPRGAKAAAAAAPVPAAAAASASLGTGPGKSCASDAALGGPFGVEQPHPALIVFDLDQTLWPFDAAHPRYDLPHRPVRGPQGVERWVQCRESLAKPFHHAVELVLELAAAGGGARQGPDDQARAPQSAGHRWRIGIASANMKHGVCCSLLRSLGLLVSQSVGSAPRAPGIDPMLLEIHPGSKSLHLQRLAELSGISFRDMLFFDDLRHNVSVAQRLGVVAVQVSRLEGVTRAAFEKGLAEWRAHRRQQGAIAAWLRPRHADAPTRAPPPKRLAADGRPAQTDFGGGPDCHGAHGTLLVDVESDSD